MIRIDKATLDAVMYKGESGNISVRYVGKDFVEGDEVVFTVKSSTSDEEFLLQTGTSLINEDGSMTISISSEDTESLDIGTYLYDITIIGEDGNIDTLILNEKLPTLEIKAGVTNGE